MRTAVGVDVDYGNCLESWISKSDILFGLACPEWAANHRPIYFELLPQVEPFF